MPSQRQRTRRARLRPTLRDVAQRAGVSSMTVSRVLNKESGVGPDKRACVEQAIRELNYVPNHAAQALATVQPTDKIAFLFDTPNATALGEMVSIGFDEAARLNVKLAFIRVRRDDDPVRTVAALENLQIQGVILSAPLCDDARLRVVLREAGVRIVAIGCGDADPGLSSIGIDDARAAYELTRYLLQLGHRRIGFIGGHPRHRSSARRRAGYEAALIEYGIEPDPRLQWEGHYTFGSALAAAEQALALHPRPTALFASNDDMAAAVISIARGQGLAVPRALSVCGFDDSEIALMTSPPLTTVRRPVSEMVRWGICQLAEELAALSRCEEPEVRHAVLDHAISYRETDAPPDCTGISFGDHVAHARVMG